VAEDSSRVQTAAIPRLGSRRSIRSPKGLIRRREKVSVLVILGVLSGIDVKPGAQAPLVKVDKLYELELSPQAAVTYSANPAKPTLNDSAQGGLVRFHTDKAGLYRVSITTGHWIDVVNGDQLIRSKDFSGSRECPRPHKIVEFELPANKDLVLQFSGSTDPSVIASITPVAATSPN